MGKKGWEISRPPYPLGVGDRVMVLDSVHSWSCVGTPSLEGPIRNAFLYSSKEGSLGGKGRKRRNTMHKELQQTKSLFLFSESNSSLLNSWLLDTVDLFLNFFFSLVFLLS